MSDVELPAPGLGALRADLDRIDDAMHQLLIARAETVARIGASGGKGPVPLRPGREAAILRRLLAQNRAPLDPAMVVRIWREIINGFTAQQARMRMVAEADVLALARGHFGVDPVIEAGSAADAIAAVAAGRAHAAIVGWPGRWWRSLPAGVQVVGRLPFVAAESGDAMVLTAAAADASGDDRTLVVGAGAALRGAGLSVLDEDGGMALGEGAGFWREGAVAGVRVIGAYAVPLAGFGFRASAE